MWLFTALAFILGAVFFLAHPKFDNPLVGILHILAKVIFAILAPGVLIVSILLTRTKLVELRMYQEHFEYPDFSRNKYFHIRYDEIRRIKYEYTNNHLTRLWIKIPKHRELHIEADSFSGLNEFVFFVSELERRRNTQNPTPTTYKRHYIVKSPIQI